MTLHTESITISDIASEPSALLGTRPAVCSAWDIVKLKDHTSLYRAYSLADGKFLFACIYADELRHSDNVQVEAVVPNAVLTGEASRTE